MTLTQKIIDLIDRLSFTEDVRQDLYVKILSMDADKVPEFESDDHLRSWLARIGYNVKMKEVAREASRRGNEHKAAEAWLFSDSDNADPLDYLEAEGVIDKIDDLSQLLRETLAALYIDGDSVADMAAQQNVTEDVIYKRISRARKLLMK